MWLEQQAHAACHLMLREKDRKLQEWQFKFDTLKSLYDELLKTLLTKMNKPDSQACLSAAADHSAAVLYLAEELRKIAVAPGDIDRIRRGVLQRLGERRSDEQLADSDSKRCRGSLSDAETMRPGERRRLAAEPHRSTQGPKQRHLQSSNDTESSELLKRDANMHKSESSLFGLNSVPTEYLSAAETVSLHLPAYSKLLKLERALFRPAKKPPSMGDGRAEERGGGTCGGRAQK